VNNLSNYKFQHEVFVVVAQMCEELYSVAKAADTVFTIDDVCETSLDIRVRHNTIEVTFYDFVLFNSDRPQFDDEVVTSNQFKEKLLKVIKDEMNTILNTLSGMNEVIQKTLIRENSGHHAQRSMQGE
jgi:hypothetical protein